MPCFYPALGQTSTVSTFPQDTFPDKTSYAYLSFFATFDEGEDAAGSWEIWTDLPADDGSSQGDWRSIRFELVDEAQVVDDHVKSDSSTAISLEPSASYPVAVREQGLTLRATAIIPAISGNTYGYTFRHVLDNGETHWLGGEGSNGIINLEPRYEGQAGSEAWSGHLEDVHGGRWEGMAIEIKNEDGYVVMSHYGLLR
jgi:hypothetical protein